MHGLTDISAAARESAPGLSKRFDAFCQSFNMVNRDNAIACYNYLNALGTQDCGVDTNIVFCRAGDAYIGGSAIAGSHTGSYWYVDQPRSLENLC